MKLTNGTFCKNALIINLVSMLAGSAMGQVSVVGFPDGAYLATNIVATNTLEIRHPIIELFTTNIVEISDEIIKALITKGRVCEVRGKHMWEESYGKLSDGVHWHSGPPPFRSCQICNAKQRRVEKWEDER